MIQDVSDEKKKYFQYISCFKVLPDTFIYDQIVKYVKYGRQISKDWCQNPWAFYCGALKERLYMSLRIVFHIEKYVFSPH